MEVTFSSWVNFGFGWFIVILAIVGYFLTWKRMNQRWGFWLVLAVGWAFFAVAQTLLIAGTEAGVPYLAAIWLSSFVLVITSLILLFMKLSRIKQ